MSISPTTPSTSFSFYPDIDFEEAQVVLPNTENEQDQVEPSRQPIPLKERICALVDRMGYRFYAGVIDLPHIMPRECARAACEKEKRQIFADKAEPFAKVKQTVLAYPESLYSWSWGHKLERENIELYGDPEFRKTKAKEYADNLHEGRASTVSGEQEWLVLSFCKQELHDLYRKEPKYLDSVSHHLWIIDGHNRAVLAKHKKNWDRLSPSEKAEKIFGKRDKYEIAAAAATAAGCFFLCHTMYQFWSSHR